MKSQEEDEDESAAESKSSSIEIEIISEEEMAFFESALAAAAAAYSSSAVPAASSSAAAGVSLWRGDVRSFKRAAASFRPRRTLTACSGRGECREIEDCGGRGKKTRRQVASLLQRFRQKKGLCVTDITDSEWCEKQKEFSLLVGRPKRTNAMKVGSARHLKLEEEVVKKVKIRIQSVEERWATRFMNFILGADQLLTEGLTRELPVIGLVEGVWMIGIIDEVRMPTTMPVQNPSLVDTKTRSTTKLPSEGQKRNARLQLMCYKYLFDKMTIDKFPTSKFFDSFGLNPEYTLSDDMRLYITSSGCHVETFGEFMTYFCNKCCLLPATHEQLLLRYEYQKDNSLLEEYQFTYDADWLRSQILECLKFWMGEREAAYVSEDERWKCTFCSFAGRCPMASSPAAIQPPTEQQEQLSQFHLMKGSNIE